MKHLLLIAILLFSLVGVSEAQFYPSGNAKQIQGRPVSPTAPTNDQSLRYNSTKKQWEPGNPTTSSTYTTTIVGGAVTIDYKNASVQTITLTGNTTVSWTLPSSGYHSFVGLKIIQNTGAHYNITWVGTSWDQGLVPLITPSDGAVDFVSCFLDSTGAYCGFGSNYH